MGKAVERPEISRNFFPLIATRIDSIPTLPITLALVLEATRRQAGSARDVALLVEIDPALTAKLLKVINSPFYGLRFKISTLSHAIAMLGLSAIRDIAAGIAPFPLSSSPGVLDKHRIWMHGLAVGTAAREIAREVGYDLPEEAYLGGLLHDLGRTVLDVYASSELAEILAAHEETGQEVFELERERLGLDHCQIGALIAERWSLPRILQDAIRHHHDPMGQLSGLPSKSRELIGIVGAADRLCWAYGFGSFGSGRRAADDLGMPAERSLSPDQIDLVLGAVGREFERVGALMGFSHGTDDEFLPALTKANAAAAGRMRPERVRPALIDRLRVIGDLARRSRGHASVNRLIDSALSSVREGLGFDRILLFELDPDEEILQGRRIFDDTHLEIEIRELSIEMSREGAIAASVRDGAGVRVTSNSTDGELLDYLGVLEAAVAPIVVNEQTHWMVCADSCFKNCEITDTDVALLGILSTEIGLSLENMVLTHRNGKLQSLALKDELTGIHNRRNLMKLIQNEIDRAKRYASPLSLVMIDIDHFKDFNDNFGHQAGDSILAEVAQHIVGASRDVDVVGRYGGEEFIVVLPETQVDQAIVYAERLRSSVESLGRERRRDYLNCHLTISVGVTCLLRDRDDIERLIHRADHALYAAKERGRNRVVVD